MWQDENDSQHVSQKEHRPMVSFFIAEKIFMTIHVFKNVNNKPF